MSCKKVIYKGSICALIFSAGIVSNSCSPASNTAAAEKQIKVGYKSSKDIVFTPEAWPEDVKGDLYQPRIVGKSPVVLLVHGGGWAENDNRYQMTGIAKTLAKRGYTVFNVTYRLAPQYNFPAPVDDLYQAIKYLKKNEQVLNIDMNRLGVFGYSAGGHLAELVAMRDMPNGVKIKAVVAGGTPHFMRVDPDFHMVKALIGKSFDEDPTPYYKATPVDQVTSNFPPVFIYHGAEDQLVPTLHVHKWVKRLEELNVEYELYWVKGRGHIGTFLLPSQSINKSIEFFDKKL